MKTIKIVLFTLLAFMYSGCNEDFLETKSTQDIDEAIIFESTTNAMMAVNGLHKLMWTADLSTSAFYGAYDMLMIWFDMMGEDLVYTYYNAQFQNQARFTAHRNITAGSLLHFYLILQYMVSNGNAIVANIDNATGPQSEKNNIKGQAYFYKAFAHFTMVQMYGKRYLPNVNNDQPGIVLRNDMLDQEPKARATVEEVYQQIHSDVDEAIRLLAATSVKRPNKSHIDVHVARGLKARVLLNQGRWKEAADMAKLVVDQSGAKLQDDTYTTVNNRFSDQSNTEWLWGSNPLPKQGKSLTHFHAYMSNTNVSYNQNSPRAIYNKLYDRISPTDVRKGVWFPNPFLTPRPIIPPHTNSKYALYMANKFVVAASEAGEWVTKDIPFMRLPEMMLVMAEGYARAGENALAADALYPLAKQRDPAYVKSTKTGNDLIDEIMIQRRVELWGEGFRYFDLKRLNMPLDRGPAPREGMGFNISRWSNTATTMPTNQDPEASNWNRYGTGSTDNLGETNRTREASSTDWEWYLPQREIDQNPLCTQNPM